MQIVVVLIALLFFTSSGSATIVLDENFSYPNGSLVSVSSGKWQTHSGTSGQVTVSSGRILLTYADSEDINAQLAGQPYPDTASITFYTRFTINFSTLPTASGSYFAHFKDSGNVFRGRLFALTEGASSGRFRIGISNAGSGAGAILPIDLELNTDYRLVTRYSVSTRTTTLWLDPVSEESPSVTATDAASAATTVAFAFRQTAGIGTFSVDDLRIGTDFGEVVAGLPPAIIAQPQSQSAIEGTEVTLQAGITGSVPLHIQWYFNDTLLPGATNATLVIGTVGEQHEGTYYVTASNLLGAVTSDTITLTVNPFVAYQPAALSLLSYNVKGNGASDWSTNSAQVQAIGRQLLFLQPDVITFQEIPQSHSSEMTNWIKAFLPGYFLAMNSGTDGYIRSAIASRYPITRSQKWLDGIDLRPFGYTNENNNLDNFSRDLFEAEILVPHFTEPFHVFTTHLKSGGTADDKAKRAAEAAAISNFFVNGFLTTNSHRPYVLTGDMNESNTNELSIQRLINPATGLHLTNPQNPYTGSFNTYSTTAANPGSRLDYIMPSGLLFSNINNSQVFRTDRLTPLPPGLQATDSRTASDHYPVLMVFNNPFEGPFQVTSFNVTSQAVTLSWQSSRGRAYTVEASTDLQNWSPLASGLIASSTNLAYSTNHSGQQRFFRVKRSD